MTFGRKPGRTHASCVPLTHANVEKKYRVAVTKAEKQREAMRSEPRDAALAERTYASSMERAGAFRYEGLIRLAALNELDVTYEQPGATPGFAPVLPPAPLRGIPAWAWIVGGVVAAMALGGKT
jgi:hypothetical protein